MEALAKEKDCSIVGRWVRSICNHLYGAAASTPDGNGDVIRDKWLSVVNHMQNIHHGHGKHFPNCLHPDLGQDDQKRKWLKSGSKACEKLSQLLEQPRLLRDVQKLSPGYQTSKIEAYHSMANHFAPKMIGFSNLGMQSRLYLGSMDFNENGSRQQAFSKAGKPQVSVSYSKYKKRQSVIHLVKTARTYDYVDRLLSRTCQEVGNDQKNCCTQNLIPAPLTHTFKRLTKEDAIARHKTRFSR
ncbi:uncharacterized protein LOC124277026 [Haliotis rubra]|uniref:uncharacterized protein LOC124277026 n=1 Tax=Haliotis rubra TaxID=36100 RepID=UPI001EE60209|nr:uncharacterized protein LOC124277026 [Haliotis rubra]